MKNEIDIYVIEKVKEMRLKKDFTQEKLGYAVNRSRVFVSRRETGPDKYNIFHLNEIAKALNCSPRDFLPERPL